jgi:hypothetical protein
MMRSKGNRNLVMPVADAISSRFDARLGRIISGAFVVYAGLIVINVIAASPVFTVIHSLIFFSTLICFNLIQDRFYFLLVTNTAWLFSFGTYAYSAIHLNAVEDGLKQPIVSSLVAGCQHSACLFAALCLGCIHLIGGQSAKGLQYRRRLAAAVGNEHIYSLAPLMLIVGYFGYILNVVAPSGFMLAFAEPIKFLFWFGLALHLRRKKAIWPPDSVLVVAVAGMLLIGMLLNSRNQILLMLLFLAIAHVAFSKRLFNFKIAVLLYLSFSLLGILSDVTLDLRLHGVRLRSPNAILSEYSERLLSADTFFSLLVPGRRSNSTALANHVEKPGFETEFYHGRMGLPERLLPLPQMDIIMGYLPSDITISWNDLLNIVAASVPDFGQEKDLVYSDRLTWKLGLRGVGNIGRPMITAVGELYSLGGYPIAFLGMFISMTLLFAEFQWITRLASDRILGMMIFLPVVVFTLITTTALSITDTVIRQAPFMMLILFTTRLISSPKITRRLSQARNTHQQ